MKNCVYFFLENVLQFHLCFLRSLCYFLGSLTAFSDPQKCKFAGIFSPYAPPWLKRFSVANMSKVEWCNDRNMLRIGNRLSTVRISTNHNNNFLVHFFGWLFHALQALVNLCLLKLYKYDIL